MSKSVCMSVPHVCSALGLELQTVVIHHMWVLGSEEQVGVLCLACCSHSARGAQCLFLVKDTW